MQLGVCTDVANAAIAKAAGADFIEGHAQQLLRPADPLWQKPVDPKTLPIPLAAYNCLFPGDLKITGPSAETLKIKAYAAKACKRCREMGSSVLVFGSGAARRIPDGWPREKAEEQLVETLRVIGPLAREAGLTIALEPLNRGESNILNSVAEGLEYLRRARTAGLTMLCDFYHMALENEPIDVLDQAGKLLSHVHVAEPNGRVAPKPRGTDLRPFFAKLKGIGYDKRISLECSWEDLGAQLPATLEYLRATWQAA
jgi:D-psicose/D-tagatose/L-ribulose 3-epimerase